MTSDAQSPATKGDIQTLMEYIHHAFEDMERRFQNLEHSFEALKKDVAAQLKESEWRMKQYFDVVAENIRHDFLHGALPDKIEQHEDLIRRLEQHAGLITA